MSGSDLNTPGDGLGAATIVGVGLWTPRFASAAARAAGERSDEELKPVGLAFDRRNRRRVSGLGRAMGDAVEEAFVGAGLDPVTTPVIVGSAIGEASTMIGLLDSMWRTREEMSPAAFTVSVHNAASGMISISKKNVGFTTSLAADHDTPFAVLLEGAGLVAASGGPVVVVCADEASPRSLMAEGDTNWDMIAAAVALAPATGQDGSGLANLDLAPAADLPTIAPSEQDPLLTGNPQAGMLDLVDAIARGASGRLRLDRGKGRGYHVALQPLAGAGGSDRGAS
ncbi:MAG: beta-ketoacyl synthase chain length factor [bacterium]|nr:beta-ketoacyl synthase chain length factor [bacterium]